MSTEATQKVRITAIEDNRRRFAVVFMGVKVAVAFSRDSGAKVGYDARMISGEIGSGGSRKNWYCIVKEGSVFEVEVDAEFYRKNKNRIRKWKIEEIGEFTMTREHSDALKKKNLIEEAMSYMDEDFSVEEQEIEKGSREHYDLFFKKLMDEFDVNGPDELDEEKKQEFFERVKREWKVEKEEGTLI